jgi:dienelactone hydrolase
MKIPSVIRSLIWLVAATTRLIVPSGAALPGLTITGNTFTYNAPDGQVTGIIRIPAGNGPFPAVLISHGKGGSASGFSLQHANVLVNWGFICIGPNYTHAGTTVNPPDNEGYCPENSRRARRCLEVLADIPGVDMSRLALFGHSMGSFITCGLAGEIPSQIKAACISAGGTTGSSDTGFASPAIQEVQGITAPFLMFHGTADTTVLPVQSSNLQGILDGKGVPSKRLLYRGINHDIINTSVKQADIHAIMRAWFTQHGVLAFAGNTPPTIAANASVTVASGSASTPVAITIGDAETAGGSLSLQAFTTDDTRLPNSAITLGGTGANRTMILTPPAGQSGTVEISIVVSDGQLSTVTYLQVTIEGGGQASVNYRPEISWIADQRTTPGVPLSGIGFTVGDFETAAGSLSITAESSNSTLLAASGITLGGNGANRTVALAPAVGQTGVATITLTVSDEARTTDTAFTLTVASVVAGNSPPTIQAVPSETISAGSVYGPVPVIIRDTESMESALTLSAASSNTALVPAANIALGGTTWGRTVQVTPASSQAGRVTVTLTVSDGANTSSTAFVLDVLSGNAIPVISDLSTVHTQSLGAVSQPIAFAVSDADTAVANLRVTGTSSNTGLLPNANIVLAGNGVDRTLTLTPLAGQTGAATVTLSITDGDYVRRAQLLYVVHDAGSPAAQFSRPRGVFILDSGGPANYTTSFGSSISLRDGNIRSHNFVDGFTLRVAWSDVESSTTPGGYDFFIIQNALNKLPSGQRLSIIIVPGEPAYIAATPGVQTWSDAGTMRATPWDGYIRERRRAMLQAMAGFATNGVELRKDPRLDLLDPYLPGGFTGIRDPNSTPLRNLPGYTRQKLLAAAQDELRSLQDQFPGKFVQLGFWPVTDLENDAYGGVSASEWLREQLLAEFNGVNRPRVGFFMENLAAKRTGLNAEPYSGSPVTAFGSALFASRDNTWNGFQMLGSWTRPFNDSHVTNTLYGSPNEAMEFAYNSYRAEYHEVYIGDVDNAAIQPVLQRWHDFYATRITTDPDCDEDGDGLPLWWEEANGLKPTVGINDDGAQGDPDRDGSVNLFEFAFALDPLKASVLGLPVITTQYDPAAQKTYLVCTYRRRIVSGALNYAVEVSGDLAGWHSGAGYLQPVGVPMPTGDGVTECVTVRALPAIEDGLGRTFVRVRVDAE